jgi:two-component system, chemotaxis family, response regulator Rcp1
MIDQQPTRPIRVLLVEDDPADVRLTLEAMKESKLHAEMDIVNNGVEALSFLHNQLGYAYAKRPDLILLDLNMPKMNGRELLARIKADSQLKRIPVVILTTSSADQDVLHAYNLGANCYITKPVDLEQFTRVVLSIEDFWFTVVKFPSV